MIADAVSASAIVFTSNRAVKAPADWNGIEFAATATGATFVGGSYASGSILRNCVVEFGGKITLWAHVALLDCRIRSNKGNGPYGIVSYLGLQDTARVTGCYITDNEDRDAGGLWVDDRVVITRSYVMRNVSQNGAGGIRFRYGGIVKDSEIRFNGITGDGYYGAGGVLVIAEGRTIIRCCTITGNYSTGYGAIGGVTFEYGGTSNSVVIEQCNVHGNNGYDFYNNLPTNADLSSNWWGSSDSSVVAAEIYDCQDDPTKGCVLLAPMLMGPVFPGWCDTATAVMPNPEMSIHLASFPNPFNPHTTIEYSLSAPSRVALGVYDVSGRFLRTLVEGHKPSGNYSTQWDGTDNRGNRVASGVYFLRLTAEGTARTKKLMLLK